MSQLTPGGVALNIQTPANVTTWPVTVATSGTDSACTSGTLYYGSIRLPGRCRLNGITYLIGSVGGTDKVIVSLHDISGTPLANSAVAGTTVGTAANTQAVPFTAPYIADGPDLYLIGLTFNGTTAKFRTVPAFCSSGVIGGSATQTFGTVAAFAPSSTVFTADKCPAGAFLY